MRPTGFPFPFSPYIPHFFLTKLCSEIARHTEGRLKSWLERLVLAETLPIIKEACLFFMLLSPFCSLLFLISLSSVSFFFLSFSFLYSDYVDQCFGEQNA